MSELASRGVGLSPTKRWGSYHNNRSSGTWTLIPRAPKRKPPGSAWNRCGVAWESVASLDRRGGTAPFWWFARRGNRTTSNQFGCEILSAVYGGGFHTGYDGARTSAFGPRGVVHIDRRNMLGDSRREDGRASGRLSRHCAWRSAYASDGHRHRDPPCAGPYSSRFNAATDNPGARLDSKRVVPRLTCDLINEPRLIGMIRTDSCTC